MSLSEWLSRRHNEGVGKWGSGEKEGMPISGVLMSGHRCRQLKRLLSLPQNCPSKEKECWALYPPLPIPSRPGLLWGEWTPWHFQADPRTASSRCLQSHQHVWSPFIWAAVHLQGWPRRWGAEGTWLQDKLNFARQW